MGAKDPECLNIVCAHLPITQETCPLTEKWLFIVIPSIFKEQKRGMLSKQGVFLGFDSWGVKLRVGV